MEEYETVILVKQEVFVFQIPPRATNRGYRAADWKLHSPDWTGRMRIVSKGKKCFIKLEDKTTGELFAKAPIDKYPGIAIESVTDSSRYFVLRIEDDNGRAAFIGIGFADRGDSFDLNVSLQEHFKWLQTSEEIEKGTNASENKPNLDLGFKEGQTITINMNIGKKSSKPRPKTSSAPFNGTPGLLPPPPGGVKLPPPSNKSLNQAPTQSTRKNSDTSAVKDDLLLDLGSLSVSSDTVEVKPESATQNTFNTDLWGGFTAATGNSSPSPAEAKSINSENWINF
ncbi:adaptin ear-binding coat-associated protein 1 [Caerostris darwini]|uniref:Adaptin ear-binding coat-associated protein 1 n=1 Tax=Caerostris darwini TaxID=1538125 RepID=A0AAV4M855_9ARAC|nr:adaptin ear-binding coat-associated protein 1 [Caerostris darwini]